MDDIHLVGNAMYCKMKAGKKIKVSVKCKLKSVLVLHSVRVSLSLEVNRT